MNPINRTNCVLHYSSVPPRAQALVVFPRIAELLQWHAERDATLSRAIVAFSSDPRNIIVTPAARNAIAVTATYDKVKLFALFFFSLPLRMLFWTFNPRIQIENRVPQRPPANNRQIVAPLDLNVLVTRVVNGEITPEDALGEIERRAPEGEQANFANHFLNVFSDGQPVQPRIQAINAPQAINVPRRVERLPNETTFAAIATRFLGNLNVDNLAQADRLLTELSESDRNAALDGFFAAMDGTLDQVRVQQDIEYELTRFIDTRRLEKKNAFANEWVRRYPRGPLAELGNYFRSSSTSLEEMQSWQRIIDETNIDEICLQQDNLAFLHGCRNAEARNYLRQHFISEYEKRKDNKMRELDVVVGGRAFMEFQGVPAFESFLSFYRDNFVPLIEIQNAINDLSKKKNYQSILGYLRDRPRYIQDNYFQERK